MSNITGANIVTFECNGASVAVEFESDFKLEAGLKPDINSAKVPYLELAKLGGIFTQPGSLVFSSTAEGSADVTIQNIYIVDLQPARVETVAGGDGPIVIEWTVHFADFRFAYVAPRGGRLRFGVLNPSGTQPTDTTDEGSSAAPNGIGGTAIKLSVLIQNCLDAMGSSAAMNGDPDSVDPPMDLQWHGNHAPTELEKLLDLAKLAFCPHLDGSASIETIGEGTPPSIPPGREIGSFDCGQVELRGKTVVIFSAPTPVIMTETINDIAMSGSKTWEYVVQDLDKTWKSLEEDPEVLGGFDPVQLIRQSFAQLDPPDKALEAQLFHCIRLNTQYYPPPLQPILTQRFEQDQSVGRPQIKANVATLPDDGVSIPSNASMMDCNCILKSEDTILVSDVRLGKMSGTPGSREDYNNLFEVLSNGDLSVRFSHEKLDDNYLPCYYVSSWQSDGAGGATKTSSGGDVGAQSAFSSPDPNTLIVSVPAFQLLNVDGTDTNLSDLDGKAQAIAPAYLSDNQMQATEVRAVGFVAADCNGLITKIEYAQRHPLTTFFLNHWYRPHTKHAKHLHRRYQKKEGIDENYPHQHEQHQKRTGLGLSGATQPNLPHGAAGGPDLPGEMVLVGIIGTETGGGRYGGTILCGPSTGNLTNNFQLQSQPNQVPTDGPKGAPIKNALVINLNEPYVNGTHLLFGDSAEIIYCLGRVMGQTTESTPRTIVYVVSWNLFPVMAKITGVYNSALAGVYYGRLLQGQFASGSNFGYSFPLSSVNSIFLPGVDNCWITNIWEQTYGTQSHSALTVGQYVLGFMAGFPQYSAISSGNTNSNNVWFQIYTFTPIQSATLIHQVLALTTSQTATSTYGSNEQSMLNNLRTDATNLQAALSNLYANLKSAGYSL